jgi:uncharacterized protein (DUF1330 family)
MKGYLVANIDVKNPEGYEAYRQAAEHLVHKYGGYYLVRGGKVDELEGEMKAGRLVILEFPSLTDAKRFYRSPEYRKVIHLRTDNSTTHMFVLVEGYEHY